MALTGEERQQLLLMERDGTLPEEMKAVVDGLRKAGQLNPALPSRREAGADVAMTIGGPKGGAEAATLPEEAPTPSLASRAATGVARAAGQAILPTAGAYLGGLGGAAIGGALTAPTVVGVPAGVTAGAIGGEALGGAAGEKLNQMLGITEPSNAQVALAAAGGPAGRVIGGALRGAGAYVLKRLPGAAGGLSEIGAETASNLPAIIRPKVSVDDLYAKVAKFNPGIPVPNLKAAIAKLQSTESDVAKGLKSSDITSITAGLDELTNRTVYGQAAAPFQQIRANLRRLGDRIRATSAEGGEVHGATKFLYKAMQEDLEQAAGSSAMGDAARTALKTANAAARKDFAATDLATVIEKQGLSTVQSGDGMLVRVHPAKIANWIRKNEDFRKSVSPGELEQLHSKLLELAKIPAPPPPRGVNVGSALVMARSLAGAGMGAATGLDPTGGVASAGIMAMAPIIISRAMMSPRGRALLVNSLKSNRGFLDHAVLANLAQVARTEGTAGRDALRQDEP